MFQARSNDERGHFSHFHSFSAQIVGQYATSTGGLSSTPQARTHPKLHDGITSIMDHGSPKSLSNHTQVSSVTSDGTICGSHRETHSLAIMKVKRNKIQCRDRFLQASRELDLSPH